MKIKLKLPESSKTFTGGVVWEVGFLKEFLGEVSSCAVFHLIYSYISSSVTYFRTTKFMRSCVEWALKRYFFLQNLPRIRDQVFCFSYDSSSLICTRILSLISFPSTEDDFKSQGLFWRFPPSFHVKTANTTEQVKSF